jgi:PAS domain S-box-containing protein
LDGGIPDVSAPREPGVVSLMIAGGGKLRPSSIVGRYGFAVLSFVVALSIRLLLAPLVGDRPLLVLFVSAVLFSAIFAGLGPAILATGLVLTYDAALKLSSDHVIAADIVNTLVFCLIVVEIYWVTERWARQRRSAELQRAETENAFDHILNALPNAVLVTDREGRILKRNRSCEATLGIPMGNIEGSNISEFLPAEYLSKVYSSDGGSRRWLRPRDPTTVILREGERDRALEVHVKEIQQAGGPAVLVWSMREIGDAREVTTAEPSEEALDPSGDAPQIPAETLHPEDAPEAGLLDLRSRYDSLSERERQVLERLVSGASNREIGVALNISPRTVETHRANIMSKMNAESFPGLVQMAFRLRLPARAGKVTRTASGAR